LTSPRQHSDAPPTSLPSDVGDTFDRGILSVWLAVLAVKLVLAAWLPLVMDETYYWVWSHHLQPSYYDHPPAVAWLLWLGHPFESWGNAVRWPAVILGHATLLVWWPIIKRILDHGQRRWWFILALLSPLVGPGTIMVVPDIPLLFSWSLALLLLLRWADRPTSVGAFMLGVALGLGFLSKYLIVLFVPLAILWLWRERRLGLLRPMWVLVGFAGFAITSWPVWLWNAANDWTSFRYQLGHGLGSTGWQPHWTWDYLLAQIGLLFPTVVYFAVRAMPGAPSWLFIFGWGPIAFFLLTSFRGNVEANWASMAYPVLIALALYGRSRFRWAQATAAVWAVLLVAVASHVAWPWLPLVRDRLRDELTAFDFFHPYVIRYQPFYADSYQMASKLSYDLRMQVYQLPGLGRTSVYYFLPEARPTQDRYFVGVKRGAMVPRQSWNRSHEEVRRIPISETHEVIEFRRRPGGAP
jgi:4-amino-4-deoxy-L-arabinose transferase-like glycosyltransferase